jgi:hypothetical protein
MQTPKYPAVHGRSSRQLCMVLDRAVLHGMTVEDRGIIVRRLARLLMEASGVDPKEISDDDR